MDAGAVRAAAALLVLLAATAPAGGETLAGTFEIEYAADQPDLGRRIEGELSAWALDAPSTLQSAAPWEAAALGPRDVVARRVTVVVRANEWLPRERRGRALVAVFLDPDDLPSGAATLRAVGAHVEQLICRRIEEQAAVRRTADLESLTLDLRRATERADALEMELNEIESAWADPAVERTVALGRRTEAERELASTHVDRVVATQELAAAREVLARVAETEALASEIESVEADGSLPSDAKIPLLKSLRKKLAEARARNPSVESARERVFDLEIRLVGLESRETLLTSEVEALRQKLKELAPIVRRHERLLRERADALDRVDAARRRLDAARSQPVPIPCNVIRGFRVEPLQGEPR